MKPTRLSRANEGEVFAIPIELGHGVVVLTRARHPYVGVGYFFLLSAEEMAKLDISKLEPLKADIIARFGHIGIRNGRWIPMGKIPGFQASQWTTPLFAVRDPKLSYAQEYDDIGVELLRMFEIDYEEAKKHPDGALFQASAMEILLRKLAARDTRR